MKKENLDYTLYLCTDRGLMSTDTLEKAVEEAILGGVTMVQLREKDCSSKEFYETALRIKKITDAYEVPLLINDRADIALAVDADGVHIGQSDLPVKIARKILGKDKIIGVSARNVAQALEAEQNGADYLGVGAMYATGTKKDAKVTSREELLKIRQAVKIPIVVIGGINQKTLSNFKGIGINGLAVVSAVIAAKDIKAAAAEMVRKFKE
ncbi:MAG: thiamine phosphate synthase [Lachnospiraceae bacterium]|nr:thiamine phosphate synthase [Lachnospiraceae bacterium]